MKISSVTRPWCPQGPGEQGHSQLSSRSKSRSGNSIWIDRVRNCVTEITAWRRPHWFWWKGNLRQRPQRPCTRSQIQVMGFSPEVRSKAFQYEMPQYPHPDHASSEDRFFSKSPKIFFSHQVFRFKFSEAELLDSKTFWEVEKNCGKVKSWEVRSGECGGVRRSPPVRVQQHSLGGAVKATAREKSNKSSYTVQAGKSREGSWKGMEKMMIRQTLFASILIIIATAATTDALYYGESLSRFSCMESKSCFLRQSSYMVNWTYSKLIFSSGCWEATAFGVSCPPPINVKWYKI